MIDVPIIVTVYFLKNIFRSNFFRYSLLLFITLSCFFTYATATVIYKDIVVKNIFASIEPYFGNPIYYKEKKCENVSQIVVKSESVISISEDYLNKMEKHFCFCKEEFSIQFCFSGNLIIVKIPKNYKKICLKKAVNIIVTKEFFLNNWISYLITFKKI